MIVDAGDRDVGSLFPVVDHAQLAGIVGIARVEETDVVMPVRIGGNDLVHGGQVPAGSADVGQHLDVQITRQFQPPVAAARPDTGVEPFGGIAVLDIVGIQMNGLVGVDGQD